MTDREKLIELLDEATEKIKELCGGLNEHNGNGVRADHLLANGVIVLPCKVGDTVWVVDKHNNKVESTTVKVIHTESFVAVEGYELKIANMLIPIVFADRDIGKTAFLTREEAEAALKEGQG